MDTPTKQYKSLEQRITKGDLDALLARWEFGRKLLAERGDAKRMADGRVEELHRDCNMRVTVTGYRMELSRRMRFAEQYPTAVNVRAAFKEFGTWHAICARGMGKRGATPDAVEAFTEFTNPAVPGVVLRVSTRPPQFPRDSRFPFMRQYAAMLGRIRGSLRPHTLEYQVLWLSALQHGIQLEIDTLERRSRAAAEPDTGLLKFAAPTAP